MTTPIHSKSQETTVPRILVVDDDESFLNFLSRWLQGEGYLCMAASSVDEALQTMGAADFDLVLADIDMPDRDGIELLAEVKEHFPDVAVIMVTGVDSRETAIRTLQLGAVGYVIKPFEKNEIIINLVNALERRRLLIESHRYEKRLEEEVRKRTRDLERSLEELKNAQQQMLRQEKMATLGHLAAGVAHEINNPVGFVSSNLNSLGKYVDRLSEFIRKQTRALQSMPEDETTQGLKDLEKKLKIDYLIEDAADLVRESLDGMERVRTIVTGLKSFARDDRDEYQEVDINECLERSLNIVWNELKYKAVLKKEYGELPAVECYAKQLGQVFMNLLVNAAHAIEEKGEIGIRTWHDTSHVYVAISDTGCGIPADTLDRIFEPFFTTKEEDKGTGLGLSIIRDILKRHHGEITVTSREGHGATFTVKIPLERHDPGSENPEEPGGSL